MRQVEEALRVYAGGGSSDRRTRFAQLASLIPHSFKGELILEHRMDEERFQALAWETRRYLSASLGYAGRVLSEEQIVETFSDPKTFVPNKTPNGLLMPKAELTMEFNMVHKCFAELLGALGFDHLTDGWQLPLNVRVVGGQVDPATRNRPYSTSKIHSDTWVGEPSDAILLNVPLLGDIERTTIEWFQVPVEVGDSFLRPLKDFTEGEEVVRQATRVDVTPKIGHIYFSDFALLHRTVRKDGRCRISLDLRIRMKTSAAAKAQVDAKSASDRLEEYVPFALWMSIGQRALVVIPETMEECRQLQANPSTSRKGFAPYTIVAYLPSER